MLLSRKQGTGGLDLSGALGPTPVAKRSAPCARQRWAALDTQVSKHDSGAHKDFFQPPADKSADPAIKLTSLIMILH
jgi:hypothetical protein